MSSSSASFLPPTSTNDDNNDGNECLLNLEVFRPSTNTTTNKNNSITADNSPPMKEQVLNSIRQCAHAVSNHNHHDDQVSSIIELITNKILLLSLKTGSGKPTVMRK